MLHSELNTARSVTHPNVCRLYDFHFVGEDDAPLFFTMELLEGETLAQRLQAGALSTQLARPLVDQVVAGLDAAHRKGIIHRDLKPANIMLTQNASAAVVMDFGLAREVAPSSDLARTLITNSFAGTPAYMAPELLRGERATISSDLHALGVVLFEMVTAHQPFEGATALEVASRRLNGDAVSPRRYVGELDRRWEYVILRCLARDPKERPESARTICELLDTRPPILWLRRRTLIVGSLFSALALGAGVVGSLSGVRPLVTVAIYDVENRTDDADLNYVCRGTTSEVVRRLTSLRNIRVIPTRKIRDDKRFARIARLALYSVLEKREGKIHLNARLSDDASGRLIWYRDYDRERFRSILELQTDMSRDAAAQLATYVARSGAPMLAAINAWWPGNTVSDGRAPTRSIAAFDYYLRGNSLLQESSEESVRVAISYFERAVSEDPKFALAFASLAEAHLSLLNFTFAPDSEVVSSARDYAERAVQEDPSLAEAHAVIGAVRQLDWSWLSAERAYDYALKLKPDFPRARRWRAGLVLQFARFEEAVADMQEAFHQDPYDRSALSGFGLTLLFAGKYQQGAELLEHGIADRDLSTARYNLCQIYARIAKSGVGATSEQYYSRAFDQAKALAAIEQRSPNRESELSSRMYALLHSLRGEFLEAAPYLEKLEQRVAAEQSSPGPLAMIYTAQNRREAALDAIERAVLLRDRFVLYLRVHVFLEELRGDPRFVAVLRKLHLK